MGGDVTRRRPTARPGPVGAAAVRGVAPSATAAGRVVRVVADVPAVHRPFDYRVPSTLDAAVEVGTEVRVVLHGRRVRGWVVAVDVEPPPGIALRPVTAVRGIGPPAAVLELAEWAAWRWAGSVVSFLRTASSPTVVRHVAASAPPVLRHVSTGSASVRPVEVTGGGVPGGVPGGGVPGLPGLLNGSGTAVVRVAPATDRRPLLRAVAAHLGSPGTAPGAGALVLVPEGEEVAKAAAQLRSAGAEVAVMPEGWARARAGGCAVVGTRAAAWAPLPALTCSVVLDAHDGSYVEQRAPTWSAWAVVAERSRRDGAPCLLVSPCPTLELLAAGRLVTPERSEERQGWPPVEVVDLRDGDPRHGVLSPRVAELGRWAVAEPGRRVAMVVNRTGGARLVACAACREIARCETCRGALELAEAPDAPRLSCRRCGASRPIVCARCGSTSTRALRLGVRRLQRDLQALVGAPVVEVTAASRGMAEVPPGGDGGVRPDEAPLVVGTEAALRGMAGLDAVVLLDLDGELLAPRLRAAEDALALLARAARRIRRSKLPATAGRAPGRLVVQTRQPAHAVVQAAVTADPSVLADEERPVRQALRLPPVASVTQLSGPGAQALVDAVRTVAVRGPADPAGVPRPVLEVDGPVDGMWTLRADVPDTICDVLAAIGRPEARVRVDVDPAGL